jgi:DNA-binding transcriptional regulator LsrR (DeoR family)
MYPDKNVEFQQHVEFQQQEQRLMYWAAVYDRQYVPQDLIAEKLQAFTAHNRKVSRNDVSRLLAQAEALGILDVRVHPPRIPALEEALQKHLGLAPDAVRVVWAEASYSIYAVLERAGVVAATFFEKCCEKLSQTRSGPLTIALSGGESVRAFAEALRCPDRLDRFENLTLVTLTGPPLEGTAVTDSSVVRLVATKYGVNEDRMHILPSPLGRCSNLGREKEIERQAKEAAKEAAIVVTGLGSLGHTSSFPLSMQVLGAQFRAFTRKEWEDVIEKEDIVGDLNHRLIKRDGTVATDAFSQRIKDLDLFAVALEPDTLIAPNRTVIAIACGKGKAAIAKAARPFYNFLVTDADCAQAILGAPPSSIDPQTIRFYLAADLYYHRKLTQEEIAGSRKWTQVAGIGKQPSRSTISRLLTLAEPQGIVDFRIRRPHFMYLEEELQQRLQLRAVRVVWSHQDDNITRWRIGQAAATLFEECCEELSQTRSDLIIALSGGESMLAFAQQLPARPLKNFTLVTLVGSPLEGVAPTDEEVVRLVADKYGLDPSSVDPYILPAASRREEKKEEEEKKILGLAADADIVVTGIGSLGSYSAEEQNSGNLVVDIGIGSLGTRSTFSLGLHALHFLHPTLDRHLQTGEYLEGALRSRDIVADLGFRLIDRDGEVIRDELCQAIADQVAAVEPERLAELSRDGRFVIAIACGEAKAAAVWATRCYYNVLITDERCAEAILKWEAPADTTQAGPYNRRS